MATSMRIGTAITAFGMIGMVSACATPGAKIANRSSVSGAKIDQANAGLATRALSALSAGDFTAAVDFAERAVEHTPGNAAFRAVLGNAYFAAGRFASAESAYRDSLSLSAGQPPVVLKLVLVSIAQGKNDSAIELLQSSRSMLDAADYGLALALAGRPADAAQLLDSAASQVGADARVRQNLALAHALAGDWTMARTVAEQDLAPNQVEGRIAQWMSFAKPVRASDQVAALTGITPAAADPGQPVRLALNPEPQRYAAAEAAPTVEPLAEAAPAPAFVAPAPVELAAAPVVPEQAPAKIAAAPLIAESAPAEIAAVPVVAEEAPTEIALPAVAVAAAMPAYIPAAPVIAEVEAAAPAPALSPRAAVANPKPVKLRQASLPTVKPGGPVVQLGAFSNRGNVESAWSRYSAKYPSLRNYAPTTARFEKGGDTIYRLSVAGFQSSRDAQSYCASLKRAGGNCFVRSSGGDQPVRIAFR